MTALALVLALITGLWLGHRLERLKTALNALNEQLKERKEARKPEPEQKATIIDPDDIVQRAQWEHEQQMKALNQDNEV